MDDDDAEEEDTPQQVVNFETMSAAQAKVMYLYFGGVYAALLLFAATGPALYTTICSYSHRCPVGVNGTNMQIKGTTPVYVTDRTLCDDLSRCQADSCYLNLHGTIDWSLQVQGLTSYNQFVLLEAAVENRGTSALSQDILIEIDLYAQGAGPAESSATGGSPPVRARFLKEAQGHAMSGGSIMGHEMDNPLERSHAAAHTAARHKGTPLLQDSLARRSLDCAAAPKDGKVGAAFTPGYVLAGARVERFREIASKLKAHMLPTPPERSLGGACEPLYLFFEPFVRWPLYAAKVHFQRMHDFLGDVHVCMHTANPDSSAFLLGLKVGLLLVALLSTAVFGLKLLRLPVAAWGVQQQWAFTLLVAAVGFNQPLLPLLLSAEGLTAPVIAAVLQALLPVALLVWPTECFECLAARPTLCYSGVSMWRLLLLPSAAASTQRTASRYARLLAAVVLWSLLTASWTAGRTNMTAAPTQKGAVWPGPLPGGARAFLLVSGFWLLGSSCSVLWSARRRITAAGFHHVRVALLTLLGAVATAAGITLGSLSLLPPTVLGAVAATGALNLYVLMLAYVYLPVTYSYGSSNEQHADADEDEDEPKLARARLINDEEC